MAPQIKATINLSSGAPLTRVYVVRGKVLKVRITEFALNESEIFCSLTFNLVYHIDLYQRTVRARHDCNYQGRRYKKRFHRNTSQAKLPVLIRDFRSKGKWTEGRIHKKLSPVSYLVILDNGIIWKRHINQLLGMQTQLDLNDNELNPRDIYLPSTVTSKNHLEAGSRQSMSPPALFSPRPGSSSEIAGTPPSSRSVTLSPPHRLTLSPAEVLPADRSQQTTPVIRRYPARQKKP
ncbi:hypothetical protein J6590_104619, partial [Homalodisca vitripennis]